MAGCQWLKTRAGRPLKTGHMASAAGLSTDTSSLQARSSLGVLASIRVSRRRQTRKPPSRRPRDPDPRRGSRPNRELETGDLPIPIPGKIGNQGKLNGNWGFPALWQGGDTDELRKKKWRPAVHTIVHMHAAHVKGPTSALRAPSRAARPVVTQLGWGVFRSLSARVYIIQVW